MPVVDAVRGQGGRAAVQGLLQRRYASRGLQLPSAPSRVPPGGCEPVMLQAREGERVIGTVSVRLDGPLGLAADAVFPEALRGLRAQGWRLCEFTRLAVDTSPTSRAVLASLFHQAHLLSHTVHGATLLVMEVHPRHVAFYRRALGAHIAAAYRMNTSVGAPSVLLTLDLAYAQAQIDAVGGTAGNKTNFYAHFYGPQAAAEVLERLRQGA